MSKVWKIMGIVLAASSALVYWNNRRARSRPSVVPAVQAAALLTEAWSDHHTRA